MAPSRTATLYRVSYRREDREPSKGYTYKVFKGEQQARSFIARLLAPPDDVPERYGKNLAPIAECHLHLAVVRWEPVEQSTSNDLVDHSGEYRHRGDVWTREELEDRRKLLMLRPDASQDDELREIEELLS